MTLQGDLATLELADIIQNLEMHKKSGTLVVEGPRGTQRLYFKSGAIALVAAEGRPSLVEDLERSGLIDAKALASARKPRWRRRRALCEVLVQRGAITEEALEEFARTRLIEDACNFLTLDSGAFTFTEERIPGGVFDPEEKHLGLALPAGPMLFESARRKDHLVAVRRQIPSDATHFVAQAETDVSGIEADPNLLRGLLERCDGSRSVRQLLEAYPSQRFQAYEALSSLVECGALRIAGPEDLLGLVQGLFGRHPERALEILEDALEGYPQHLGLLREKANLCERQGDGSAAAEALKVIVHLELEAGNRETANEDLNRAVELAPNDPTILERRLDIAIQEERREDAIKNGLRLVEMHRGPGLHAKAAAVLERLVKLDPYSWDLRRELARSQADCGNPTLAVADLRRFGKKLLARGDDRVAREVQEEILTLVPKHEGAQRTIELIDGQVFEKRRETRQRALRRLVATAVAIPLGLYVVLDVAARRAYSEANRTVADLELIEARRYDEAATLYSGVRESFPWTLTSWLEVRQHVELLDERRPPARVPEPTRSQAPRTLANHPEE